MASALQRNIDAIETSNATDQRDAGWPAHLAGLITAVAGSMGFVLFHLVVFGLWIAAGMGLVPGIPRIDHGFSTLGMAASVEAIFLSTFVLISQNRMAAMSEKRADLDLQVSLLTEHELTRMAQLLRLLAEKQGVEIPSDRGLDEIERDIAPEAVMNEIELRRQR